MLNYEVITSCSSHFDLIESAVSGQRFSADNFPFNFEEPDF
jgi:hypothetical protein